MKTRIAGVGLSLGIIALAVVSLFYLSIGSIGLWSREKETNKWFALAVISFFILMATLFIGSLILGGMIK